MLLLTFRLGNDRYGVDVADVIELLPLVNMKQLPHAPPGIAGLLDYHGTLLPAVDLCMLAIGRPARSLMSTRIAVVRDVSGEGPEIPLAVILESAVELVRKESSVFASSGVDIPEAPYLGTVACDEAGVIQQIDVRRLLGEDIRQRLLPSATESAGRRS